MTVKTPLHLQRRSLVSDGHLIDATMASGAANALIHMDAVVEIRIVGEIVNPNPLDRLPAAKAGTDRFQIGALGPNLLVAVHAGFCRGHTRRGGSFYRCVAVSAVDTVVPGVVFMAELNRLLAFNPLACIPGGAVQFGSYPERRQ